MARAGINYIDVTKAAQAIQSKGQNPTVDRVLAHLGTGSKSTIAPLLKQWKIEQGQIADTAGLPDDILKAVKDIHDRLQQSAEVKIEQALTESHAQVATVKKSLQGASEQIERLKQDNAQLISQLQSNQEENNQLKEQLETKNIAVARLTADNEALTSQVTQFKVNINEKKQEVRHIRTSFEHYQTQAAEDRQLEREQYQISKRQLEERIQATNQQLNNEFKRSEKLAAEKEEIAKQITLLSSELDNAKQTIQDQDLNNTVLIQKIDTKENQLEELQLKMKNLDSKYTTLIKENSGLQTDKQLLEQELTQLKTRLSETEDKVTLLINENKIILQEKSVLLGQFKQLQESL